MEHRMLAGFVLVVIATGYIQGGILQQLMGERDRIVGRDRRDIGSGGRSRQSDDLRENDLSTDLRRLLEVRRSFTTAYRDRRGYNYSWCILCGYQAKKSSCRDYQNMPNCIAPAA